MRIIIIMLVFICAWSYAPAQINYVRNPDFERYDTCPYKWDQITLAKYWSSIDSFSTLTKGACMPEYCNTCASGNPDVGIPGNGGFYQNPHSGNGFTMGYYFCDEIPPPPAPLFYYRDYLQGRLFKPLTSGKSYCVSFFINLADRTGYATNKMGAYLDDGSIDTVSICSKPITFIKPQVFSNKVLVDTQNWEKVEGSFTANGTERFITIGNFFPKDSVTYMFAGIGGQWAYYLIDDVSVIESDLAADAGKDTHAELGKKAMIGRVGDSTAIGIDCKWYKKGILIDSGATISVNGGASLGAIDTYMVVQTVCGLVKTDTVTVTTVPLGMKDFDTKKPLNIYPNPSTGIINIGSLLNVSGVSAKVYDLLGRTVYQGEVLFANNKATIEINATSGFYILELKEAESNAYRQRIEILK